MRYRYDEKRKKRYKTVELIVDEVAWQPKARPIKGNAIVSVQIGYHEKGLQERAKQAGGRWNPDSKLWELRYDRVLSLGIESRIRRRAI